jgi:hypothetical protein
VNDDAVRFVRGLIDKKQYVLDSDWGQVQPDAEAQNAYLERHSTKNPGSSKNSKENP